MKTKSIIFISHANPQDNYFSTWLASKLIVLGYNAWVDVDDFKAGDAFFTTIQPLIKDKAIRFIAVNSEAYIEKSKDQNTGVSRELNTAITVRNIENFILPIRIDAVDFNDFPSHYASWNAIDFNNNWQLGLIDLVKQLEKMNIPKNDSISNPIETWFKVIKNENRVIDKIEKCYANWFPFELPEHIYIHRSDNVEKEMYVSLPFPIILEAGRIITFASDTTTRKYFPLFNSKRYTTSEFQNSDELEVDDSFTLIEPKKKLVRLLNQCFKYHLRKSDLSYWRKRDLNYFITTETGEKAVSLKKRFGKGSRMLVGSKTVKINGKTTKVNWHYAISPRVELYPFPHFRLYYTLIFTNDEGKGLGKKNSAALRRSVPSDWYNRKWFETMLAAMLKISDIDDDRSLLIEIDDEKFLRIENQPVGGEIQKGYYEPN